LYQATKIHASQITINYNYDTCTDKITIAPYYVKTVKE